MGTFSNQPSDQLKQFNVLGSLNPSPNQGSSQSNDNIPRHRFQNDSSSAQPLLEKNMKDTASTKHGIPDSQPKRKTLQVSLLIMIILIGASSVIYMNPSNVSTKLTNDLIIPNKGSDLKTPPPSPQTVSSSPDVKPDRTHNQDNVMLDIDKLTKLTTKLTRDQIQAGLDHKQVLPMLVSLAVEDLANINRAPLDLVCVIDKSGSMLADGKMELVKKTFNYLLEYLGDKDRISIITFNFDAEVIVPLTNVTSVNKKQILSSIATIYAGGGTTIASGMKSALDLLKRRVTVNQATSIFLLSDGLDQEAQVQVKEVLISSELENSLTIQSFGFGADHDPRLMIDIADLTDGSFYFIEKLDQIDEAFVGCLGGLQSSIAKSVEISITPKRSRLLQDIEIVKAYGDATMWKYNGNAYSTKISNLMAGIRKEYVLELKIPATQLLKNGESQQIKVASIEAIMTGFDGQEIRKKADLFITLVNEQVDQEDDKDVMLNFYRVKGASLMDQASKFAEGSRYEEAKKVLEEFKSNLENSSLKEEESAKEMVMDLKKAIDYVRPDSYHASGKQNLMGNSRAQMRQQNNLDLSMQMTNTHLDKMHFALAIMKSADE